MGERSSLRLLGPALVERNGQAVRGLASGKALALLAYLIVYGQPSARGQPVSREHLADLFWRHLPPDRGRANLCRVCAGDRRRWLRQGRLPCGGVG